MHKAGCYSILQGPDLSRPEEADGFVCCHCNKAVMCIDHRTKKKVDPMDLGGMCGQCWKMICPDCVNLGRCTPLEAKIEHMERRRRFHASIGA